MTAVFISHSSKEGTQAAKVKAWLNDQGFENVFLDLDREGGLRAGENWERRLYEEVARCHAVILVVTPAWLESKWCFAEFSMARSLGKVIFPVLLRHDDIAVIGPELGSIQAEQWNDEGKQHLAARLNSVAFEIARGHRYVKDRPPYPGILSFEEPDAAVFFGRDPEIRRISERLEARRVQGGARLLMVVGPSGSGKSSVVKAGVLPWLARYDRRWIVVPPFRPGQAALTRLSKALAEANRAAERWRELRARLIDSPEAALTEIFETLLVGTAREATVLITVDQFEEVFATKEDAERKAFVELLAMIARHSMPVLVLATVRSDLMGEILKSQAFDVPHEVFTLGQLPTDRLPQVIEGPAHVASVRLEDGLADRVIEDAVSADALPLLAFTMRELYERHGRDGRLTIMEYEALGDPAAGLSPLENAIRRKAEETIATAAPAAAELDALKEAFVSGLVRVNEDGVRLRRPAVLEELPEPARPLIQRLIQARLLSARGEDEERLIEVAHEALFRAWPQLKLWLDDEQDFLIGRRHIEEAREIWQATPDAKKDRALLSGLLLERAREWTLNHPGRLADIRDFVLASIRKEDREKARIRRRQLTLTVTAVAAAVVFAVLGVAASLQWSRAEQAAALAETEARRAQESELAAADARRQAEDRFALALGAVASGLASEDPRLALFLAGEAVARGVGQAPGFTARAAMVDARLRLATHAPHPLQSPLPSGDALALALAPGGDVLALGDRDGRLRLFDGDGRWQPGDPIEAHGGGIESLAFDATGRLLASASNDGTVRLWRLDGARVLASDVIHDFGDVAWSVAFDRTGTQLAASSQTGALKVWRIGADRRNALLAEIPGEGDSLSVAFGPDGRTLLAGNGEGGVQGWRIDSGLPLFAPVTGVHSSGVWQILFSPMGDRFITVSTDGSSALFAYPDGAFLGYVLPRERQIVSVAFNRTGEAVVGGSEDGRLHLAEVGSRDASRRSAARHQGRIIEIGMRADGQLLASLGRDQTVRFWTLFDPVPVADDRRIGEPAKGVALAPGSGAVAAGGSSGTIYLWRDDMGLPRRLEGHASGVWALAFSADSQRLASADRAGEVRLWAAPGDTSVRIAAPDGAAVWWVGFDPDGTRLAAAGDAGLVIHDLAGETAGTRRVLTGNPMTGGAISPDGTLLAATSRDGRILLYDLVSGALLRDFRVIEDIVWNLAFSPDGTVIAAAGSDETVSLWETRTARKLADLGGHAGGATDLAYLGDGATLSVLDRKGQLHFWDVATQRRLAEPLPAHSGAAWRLAATGTGAGVATTGDDGAIRVWDILDTGRACRLGRAAMDAQRRREYFGLDKGRLACADTDD